VNDPVAQFVNRLNSVVKPGHRVLTSEPGRVECVCAQGARPADRRRRSRPARQREPALDAGLSADIYALPFRDNSFDVAFSITPEHVDRQPNRRDRACCLAWRRVPVPDAERVPLRDLRPRLTPTSFHRWANERRGRRRTTFPTCYQLNCASFEQHFSAAGLTRSYRRAIEVQPNYLTFSPIACWRRLRGRQRDRTAVVVPRNHRPVRKTPYFGVAAHRLNDRSRRVMHILHV
jgi:hypothetical protein